MNYVKSFKINGIDTKQAACIELRGKPNAATEGAVGVLGVDVTSPTNDIYKCVAVNGSIYTWELLSAGMSIMSSTYSGRSAATVYFQYTTLLIPENYVVKVGDLILDREGYLYQIDALTAVSCRAKYCGTQIGGMSSGDKNCRLQVTDGKLQLVTESGGVISSIDYLTPDGTSIQRNSAGVMSVRGIYTIGGTILKIFRGTQAEYDALTKAQKTNLFPIITDAITAPELATNLENGTTVVAKATTATSLEATWSNLIYAGTTPPYLGQFQVNVTNGKVYVIQARMKDGGMDVFLITPSGVGARSGVSCHGLVCILQSGSGARCIYFAPYEQVAAGTYQISTDIESIQIREI